MFNIVNLYDGIYKILASDQVILSSLGIGVGATALTKAKKIQKRNKPQGLATNIPMITFYAPPGEGSYTNHLVYNAPFVFDVITSDDVELAHDITSRINELFHQEINIFAGVENFEAQLVTQHESRTDLPNTYCFTTVIQFSVSLDM